ncbi:MAG: HD domain-containing protein [Treponema sp.]|jgi:GTP pyrophosphokinase|nr:HD domain-containing protein [Treponema sp.]
MNPAIAMFSEKIASYPRKDQERILAAAVFAGDTRRDNFHHNLGTAAIVAGLVPDADAVVAALLRDCLPEAKESVEKRFGTIPLAEEAVKLNKIGSRGKSAKEAENARKMLFALTGDIRAILIKLADSLHTMRTLDFFPREETKSRAQEGLDVYAPLADRLGISWIKVELEDLALKHLNRDAYLQIKEIVSLKRGERGEFLSSVRARITKEAAAAGIPIETESRAKHFYSIYQKMRKRNKAPGELFDLLGLRLLCPGMEHCYTLLGMIHRLWKPVEGRFKDYIAAPKPNGYQSLHTTVFAESSGEDPLMLEIQIRTFEMHKTAEYGVAGHWIYKQGKAGDMSLINRLKTWNEENSAAFHQRWNTVFLDEIRKDILKNSIYVFTPQGKIIELPAGSTPLDFAYRIHSAVGDHCMAAKADGVIIPLDSELKSTQVVEILTSSSAHPHRNWLNEVKTAKAKSKIRGWLLEHEEAGKAKKKEEAGRTRESRPKTEPDREAGEELRVRGSPVFKVRVGDEKNMLIRFAKCCRPILGDPIVGYVSRGRGIVIHRRGCGNLAGIPDVSERLIETQWENASVPIRRFRVEARRKEALFSEIEGAVRKFRGHLIEGKLEETSENHLTGYFTVQLEAPEDAARVLKQIRGIPAVFSIQSLG